MYDGASLMTLSERDAYLDPGAGGLNVTWGYPEGLSPGWVRELQVGPPGGFLDQRPGEYEAVIRGYFAGFFGCPAGGVSLAPSATMAFAVAVQAIMGSPGDEFVLADCSYDSYPGLLGALGARVRYARRQVGGVLDVASVAAACTARTRAVVVVSPDNPLGVVCPPQVWEQLIALCRERGITLLADHCLAEVNPRGVPVPVLPSLAAGRGL